MKSKRQLAGAALASASVLGGAGLANAVTPGYSLPLDQNWFTANRPAPLNYCHHSGSPAPGGTCGNEDERWWATDLFSQQTNPPVYAVTGGRAVRIANGVFRLSLASSPGPGINWAYYHGVTNTGKVSSEGQVVSTGTLIMTMSDVNTSPGNRHLHLEARQLDGDNGWSAGHYYYGYCTRRIVKKIDRNLSFQYWTEFAGYLRHTSVPNGQGGMKENADLLNLYDAGCIGGE
jgi:hypothetical protein